MLYFGSARHPWDSHSHSYGNPFYYATNNEPDNPDSGDESYGVSKEGTLIHSTSLDLSCVNGDENIHDRLSMLLASVHCEISSADKLKWLRRQLIGDKLQFPTPFGKRHLLYVDHTASGRSLLFIETFITKHVLPYYGNTHTDDSFVGQTISRIVHSSAEYIKKRLGGSRDDALLFCGSGCTAALKRLQEVMGIAVPSTLRCRMLETLRDEEKWVVFTGPYEHHSNLLSWRQSLAEVVEIPADNEGCIDMVALETALESPCYRNRRKLGTFSACSNVTGLITDTRAISGLLHKHGAFACFDFAASAPHSQIDMRSSQRDGYDALVLSPHKFPGGSGTSGILLMRKSLYMLGKHPPSTCGGGTVSYVNGFSEADTLYSNRIEEREDGGTPPILQKIRCALAFWVKEFMGNRLIEQRETYFIKKALIRLSANHNIQILGSKTARRAPILSFLVLTTERKGHVNGFEPPPSKAATTSPTHGKPLHGRFVVKLLNDLFGIQARGGCACAGPYGHTLLKVGREQSLALRSAIKKGYEGVKPGWARLSFGYEMTEEDVEYVLAAIEFLAKYGQRFLALYDFDWRKGDFTFKKTDSIMGAQLLSSHLRPQSDVKAPLVDYREDVRKPIRQKAVDLYDSANNGYEGGSPITVRSSVHRQDSASNGYFSRCLRTAQAVADHLPPFPLPRSVPYDLRQTELLLFRL